MEADRIVLVTGSVVLVVVCSSEVDVKIIDIVASLADDEMGTVGVSVYDL